MKPAPSISPAKPAPVQSATCFASGNGETCTTCLASQGCFAGLHGESCVSPVCMAEYL